ncbi:hypothetical protein BJX70DRAFT_398918 [Aspergillus crustosus]
MDVSLLTCLLQFTAYYRLQSLGNLILRCLKAWLASLRETRNVGETFLSSYPTVAHLSSSRWHWDLLHYLATIVGAMGCAASRDARQPASQMIHQDQWQPQLHHHQQQHPPPVPMPIDSSDPALRPSPVEPNTMDEPFHPGATGYAASRDPQQHGFQMPSERQWEQPPQIVPPMINPPSARPYPGSFDPNGMHTTLHGGQPVKPLSFDTPRAQALNTRNEFVPAPSVKPASAALPPLNFLSPGPSSPPPVEKVRTSSNTTPQISLGTGTIRAYACDKDLINAYYIYIHPYLPLLPPPAIPQSPDCPTEVTPLSSEPDRSSLPFWPTSPLTLAVSALLVLIPLSKDFDSLSEKATLLRRSYAQLFLQSCEQSLEQNAERRQFNMTSYASTYTFYQSSSLHPGLPVNLEPILALLLLAVYDYCQRGSRKHMRSRAHQALTAAMDISLHALGVEAAEAQRRTWWMVMYLASQSSISNHSAPIILIHDARITTPYPEFRSHHEPWELLMESQHLLMQAGSISKQLAKGRNKANLPKTAADEIRRLDTLALAIGAKLEDSESLSNQDGAEAFAARNLWAFALLFVHTARIKLHSYLAFGDYPLLSHKPSDAKTTNLSTNLTSSSATPPSTNYAPHPWPTNASNNAAYRSTTQQESAEICLNSALTISRISRHLPPPYPEPTNPSEHKRPSISMNMNMTLNSANHFPRSLPYLTCGIMQSCYVLGTLIQRLRASLYTRDFSACRYLLRAPSASSTGTGTRTEVQDAERAVEELQNGIEVLYTALRCDGAVFEGVGEMARELEGGFGEHALASDGATVPASFRM